MKVNIDLNKKQKNISILFFILSSFLSQTKNHIKSNFSSNISIYDMPLPEVKFFKDTINSYYKVNQEKIRYSNIIKQKD